MKRHEGDQRHAAAFRARQKVQAVVEAKAWQQELQKLARRGRGRSDVPSMPFRLPSTGMKKKKKKKRGRPQVRVCVGGGVVECQATILRGISLTLDY